MRKGSALFPIVIVLATSLLAIYAFTANKNVNNRYGIDNSPPSKFLKSFGNLLANLIHQRQDRFTIDKKNQSSPSTSVSLNSTRSAPTGTSDIPSLSSVSPTSSKANEPLILKGSGFGSTSGSVIFETDTTNGCCGVNPASWNNTEIKVNTINFGPKGKKYIKIQTASGKLSNRLNFEVIAGQPIINSITPSSVKPYDGAITISGQDFGAKEGYVGFEDTSAQNAGGCIIKSWNDNQITCDNISVPSAGREYLLFIRTGDGILSSRKSYYVGQ